MPDTAPSMFQVFIRASLEEVWQEITRTDDVIPAFFNNRMHVRSLEPGSRLAMRTPDGKYTGVVGEILEVVPLKRFSHTFQFTNLDDPACTVIYDLEQADGGVKFTLTIDDLPVGTKTAKQMIQGGKMIVGTLRAVLETGKPSFGIRMLYVLFKLLQPTSPKRCRSENWPIDTPATNGSSH